MSAYYNEIDPFAAQWLRELIKAGHIAPGEVDTRNIEDVAADDLAGFTQCHFFAGIGTWSYALRCAGWPDDRPVWTGSCPCQPFSAAGKRKGTADERHLWPAFFRLISECRPDTVFGEQVASPDGLAWFDIVSSDLEAADYACGAVDTCAAGFGAPHIRQRLYWVAYAMQSGRPTWGAIPRDGQAAGSCSNVRMADAAIGSGRAGLCDLQKGKQRGDLVTNRSAICGLADASERGIRTRDWQPCESIQRKGTDRGHGFSCGMDNAGSTRLERYAGDADDKTGRKEQNGSAPASGGTGWLEHSGSERRERGETTSPGHDDEWAPSQRQKSKYGPGIAGSHRLFGDSSGPTNGFWGAADWLFCRDDKWRPVEPGTFPLAYGTPQRVGRLRGYGNAIVAPQAAAFISAFMEWKHAYRI